MSIYTIDYSDVELMKMLDAALAWHRRREASLQARIRDVQITIENIDRANSGDPEYHRH